MKVSQRFNHTQTLRSLTPHEQAFGKQIFEINLEFNPVDTVLLVTDEKMLELEAAIWFETARTLGLPIDVIVLADMTHSGEEPPEEVITAAEQASINFFQTSYSLTHTQAGKKAILHNGRGISLPGADYDLLMRTLSIDYTPVKTLGDRLKATLEQHKTIHVTSGEGTDLTAAIRPTKVINDSGFFTPGELGNLPAGEVFFAPLPGTAQGTLVIDGSVADDVLDAPITITIKNGVAVKIDGGIAAKNLWEKLNAYGEAGRQVAEIGIGTNPAATISDNLLEAEKVYGTVHVAFGNSSAIGGENNVPIHIDGLIAAPRVTIGTSIILEDRTFRL